MIIGAGKHVCQESTDEEQRRQLSQCTILERHSQWSVGKNNFKEESDILENMHICFLSAPPKGQ